ncbi:MAG: 5'-deoxynucleotidase [Eubacteriales bacterium]|nr:5'-deoxynucleotidase [Eubacteriales bacterium]
MTSESDKFPTNFYALLHRMRFIKRWSLMRNSEQENLQEHSLEVAYYAHALSLIRKEVAPEALTLDPRLCVMLALYHDVAEIITGDLATPIKYYNDKIHTAYSEVEAEALDLLLASLPPKLRKAYQPYLQPDMEDETIAAAYRVVKAADSLSAYIKCLDERRLGNLEFSQAEASILEKLQSYKLPELDWFMTHCLPTFELTLDELKGETPTK